MSINIIEAEAKPEAEATVVVAPNRQDTNARPTFCYFHNYHSICYDYYYIVNRTYEEPFKWYFLTFKPFDKPYMKDPLFYQKKGIEHCRKKVGTVQAYFYTREIIAEKVHINALILSKTDISKLHEKQTNKYYIYCQTIPNIDRFKVFDYIFKESRERYFNKYIDFAIYSK